MNPFAALIGLIFPAHLIAEKIIRQTLLASGLDAAGYPVRELAARAVSVTKFKARMLREWYRLHLFDGVSGVAYMAVYVSIGHSPWSAKDLKREFDAGQPNYVWEILAKHDPARFSFEALAQTQAANAGRLAAE